jgi:MFS family permease
LIFRGRLWRHGDFLRLWSGQSISVLGTAVTWFALPSTAILALHAGPLQVGILAALERLPFLFFSLVAGAWLDRVRRRPVMIACDAGRAVVLASVPIAAVLHLLTLDQLYLVAFLVGTFTVFFDVAYLAYLPSLVPQGTLLEGNTKMHAAHSVADLIGPGVAGLLVQLLGAARAIAVDAVSYLVSVAMLLSIRAPELRNAAIQGSPPASIRGEIGEGLRWVWAHPLIRSQLIGLTVGGLGFWMALPMVLVFIYTVLHLAPALAGLIFVFEGLAALAGLLISAAVVRILNLGRTMWASQLVMASGLLLFPVAALGFPLVVLAAASVLLGAGGTVQDVNQVTLRQTQTPARLQGRMNATFRLFFWGSQPVAAFAGGLLASRIGPAGTILVGGLLAAASAALIAFSPLGRVREAPEPVAV